MNEPVVLKNSLNVVIVAALQMVAPPLIAVSCLYAVLAAYGVRFDQSYHSVAVLVGLLALLLPRPAVTFESQFHSRTVPIALGVLARWAALLVALLLIGYATKFSGHYSRRAMLTWALMGPLFIVATMLVLHEVMRKYLLNPRNARKTVFAGCTESSVALAIAASAAAREFGMDRVIGFLMTVAGNGSTSHGDVHLLGKLNDLAAYIRIHRVEVIFIALPVKQVARVMALMQELRDTTASIYYLPDLLLFDLIQARSIVIDGIPAISLCETPFFGYRAIAKRITDVLVSTSILVLAAPLMIAIAFLVWVSSSGPIIFRQRRYGLNGEEILVYKFRTMTVTEDGPTIKQATKSDARFTRVGRFLRRYSLDELPQLINVIKGPMSLVGPRPHAVAHNEEYRKLISGYMVRHKVKPGITGLAQVNGLRGETRTLDQMEARVRYDLEYLRTWSLKLDVKILFRLVLCVFNDAKAF